MRNVAVCWLLVAALSACGPPKTSYSGTLQAPSAAVGSTIGGRVVRVFTSEGAAIRTGDPLVEFDDRQERAAVASAIGRLNQARAAVADLLAGTRPEDLARARALAAQQYAQWQIARAGLPYQSNIARNQLREALAQEQNARADAVNARADASRAGSLFSTGDVSAQAHDAAVARAERADAVVANSVAAVRAARSQTANATDVSLPQTAVAAKAAYEASHQQYLALAAGPRPDQVRQARAAVGSAMGELNDARTRLSETLVQSPADGMVTSMDLHPGDLIAAGAPVATIEERGNPYVRIYVAQTDLGRFSVGQHVNAYPDSTPATFEGYVEAIDPRAQFTPQSVQTKNDRAVLSFGVKVRIRDPQQRLLPGTTVEVSVP